MAFTSAGQLPKFCFSVQYAKQELANFIHADEADLVHLTNATAAVNTVLFSSKLRQGDLVLITSITYPAVGLPLHCNTS